jgi:hypothetical protein
MMLVSVPPTSLWRPREMERGKMVGKKSRHGGGSDGLAWISTCIWYCQ